MKKYLVLGLLLVGSNAFALENAVKINLRIVPGFTMTMDKTTLGLGDLLPGDSKEETLKLTVTAVPNRPWKLRVAGGQLRNVETQAVIETNYFRYRTSPDGDWAPVAADGSIFFDSNLQGEFSSTVELDLQLQFQIPDTIPVGEYDTSLILSLSHQ